MTIELIDYDSAEGFRDRDAQGDLLRDAVETGEATYIAHALGIIARANGMTDVARDTGLKRQQLYVALSEKGNPTLSTMLKVLDALGLKMTIAPKTA